MIVTCAACSTRYLVDPLALGPTGRRVRCACCAQSWHQNPPEDAPLRIDPPAAEAPRSGRIQLPALREPPSRRRAGYAANWGLAALALGVLLVVGAVWERAAVARVWPPASRVFAFIGLTTAPAGSGLDLRIEATARAIDNGVPALVVDGVIANVSQIARAVPKLKVILRDNAEHELQSRTFSVTDERLLPGASVPFHTTVDAPADAATQVAVTFAANGG